MWVEYLTERLSSPNSQVLLALLLARRVESLLTQAEFATLSGLSEWSVRVVLTRLEYETLIGIIPQNSLQVLAPLPQVSGITSVRVVEEVQNVVGTRTHPSLPPSASIVVLEACRRAETTEEKVAALRAVWDVAFPQEVYPYQRLTDGAAKKFLANGRSAEEVGEAILDAAANAKEPIRAPRAFIEKSLENVAKRKSKSVSAGSASDVVVNDDLRRLVQLGKKQYGKANKQ